MGLSGKERRILADIELALERDDPELARRVAAINRIESGGEAVPHTADPPVTRMTWSAGRARGRPVVHRWLIVLAVVVTLFLLVLAVATA
ncbi:DUF3040 domain-containing protein [Nonomuraea sp. SBT364]|uniref:DUF3040 domain-containing protein n=1 Tax=Nonomuraea sp. SBT364 TaxID=1580530 RepID=UPI00066E993A|nr:DUF3040 domain-containing protein [Nonomuraea sp. SBT364]